MVNVVETNTQALFLKAQVSLHKRGQKDFRSQMQWATTSKYCFSDLIGQLKNEFTVIVTGQYKTHTSQTHKMPSQS